jgi:hypothetical protein
MLIEWGLRHADEAGLEVYVEASAMGLPLYSRCGFQTQKVLPFDLTTYGGQGQQTHYACIKLLVLLSMVLLIGFSA